MAAFAGAINVDCPACGRELPTIKIATRTAQFDLIEPIEVKLSPVLDDEWWNEVRKDHAGCVLG